MSTSVKVVRTDRELECPGLDAALRARGVDLVTLPETVSPVELMEQTADADLILMCYTPITAEVINNAVKLKGIVKYGVGIDAIDIPAAIRRGIPVVNVPEYAEETVAEGAFAMMIALAKRLPGVSRAMAEKGWIWPEMKWLGRDVAGSTVGLVGFGRIGRSLARMAGSGFRARVLAFDPHVDAQAMEAAGVEKVEDIGELLERSDFVSIHSVLSEQSRHLIGRAELARMKPDAILINAARGAIIDEAALVEAIIQGRIGAVGLDVYSQEPLALQGHPLSPLFGRDNVILFPHLTFFTKEAHERLEADTLARCLEVLEGRPVTVRSHDPRLRAQKAGVHFI